MNCITEKQKCTGCGACVDICPKGCVSIALDDDGFLVSEIDESICINCMKCRKVCPSLVLPRMNPIKRILSASAKDKTILAESSSGGMFTVIAKYALDKGGVVYGAQFDDNLNCVHASTDNISGISPMRGSKYIGSNLAGIYKSVKNDLAKGIFVLFSGTPCQNAALSNYLGKDYDNLLAVDFLCHGVGSTRLFNAYIRFLETKYGSKAKTAYFRKKRKNFLQPNFKVEFQNGKSYTDYNYLNVFGSNFANRKNIKSSCNRCAFSSKDRATDFTIGDYGLKNVFRFPNWKSGVSVITLNTKKAQRVFNVVKEEISGEEKRREETVCIISTLNRRNLSDEIRDKFFAVVKSVGFDAFVETNYKVSFIRKRKYMYTFFLRRVSSMLPMSVKRVLKSWLLNR
ncbi:MAG: Coenzyme F420 hydrogenase/dehydrogenase, beta subunit C-terminal domain [Clostridiales bacterium]|jgi:coenzyme F420-reducing hydrogenase beta subunit|nr:Coenzyme F420 hydrogenase/dehydrogenase, beta subunit C-terminal domain [Clostridiales bacterium]